MDDKFHAELRRIATIAKNISNDLNAEPVNPKIENPEEISVTSEPDLPVSPQLPVAANTSLAEETEPISAFVSWAHASSSWTPERVQEWEQAVVTFTTTLRVSCGINADVDLYHFADQEIDWTRYGPSKVRDCDFVLVVISESWGERWKGTNKPTEGAGAVGEADALRGLFSRDQSEWQRRVKVVILPGIPDNALPDDLARLSRFWVNPDDLDSYDELLRTLTKQPLYEAPAIGNTPTLPSAVMRAAQRSRSGKLRRNQSELQMLRSELNELLQRLKEAEKRDAVDESTSLRHQITVVQTFLDNLATS